GDRLLAVIADEERPAFVPSAGGLARTLCRRARDRDDARPRTGAGATGAHRKHRLLVAASARGHPATALVARYRPRSRLDPCRPRARRPDRISAVAGGADRLGARGGAIARLRLRCA